MAEGIEFIRSQVEPEIVDKRGAVQTLYGASESARAYKPGFGDFIPYEPHEHDASELGDEVDVPEELLT